MTKKISTILPFVLIAQLLFSQTLDKKKLDNYFEGLKKNNKFMGSVAISENGKIIYSKSIGFSDVDNKIKADEKTKYRTGSISKTFTCVLAFKAIEEGKLTLDTRLNAYFPSIKNASKITIANLLHHTSGIHSYTDDDAFFETRTQKKSEEAMVQIIEKGGSDFPPDSICKYSNSNYVLLAYILQKVYKKPYADLLMEKICSPIDLKNTYEGDKINLQKNECYSYTYEGNWSRFEETDMSNTIGAGSVVSTPGDLIQFSEALFAGKIINRKSIETMKTLKGELGMGLITIPFDTKIGFGHNGSIDEFKSLFGYFENEKVAFAITSNGGSYNCESISVALLSAVFNKPYELPNFKKYDVAEADLDKYVGVYASSEMPLKMNITRNGKALQIQATGKPQFELEATDKDIFENQKIGIMLIFNPAERKMILKDHKTFTFTKE
jgi:D-alanyl-D-alanine carboxypeptidase